MTIIETKLNGIRELKELLDAGTISVNEFNALKKDLLGSKTESIKASSETLAQDIQAPDNTSQKANSSNGVIAIAAILLLAFFLPWVDVFFSLSAYDLVFGDVGDYIIPPVRFFAALIPISGVIVIIGALKNGQYFIWKPLLFSIPLLALAFIGLIINEKTGIGNALQVEGVLEAFIKGMLKTFEIGFWLTLVVSVILFFVGFTSNKNKITETIKT